MTKPLVFISYSHKDEIEKEQLVSHLKVLESSGSIELWTDDKIEGGADWKEEIKQKIAQARVVILLISANFLTSEFILSKEVPDFLKRRQSEGLTVFPVIAKSCAWDTFDWLVKMNVRPQDDMPVWSDNPDQIDKRLTAITKEIRDIVKRKMTKEVTPDFAPDSKTPSPTLKKTFLAWIIGGLIFALGWTIYTFYGDAPTPTTPLSTVATVAFVPTVTHTPNLTIIRTPIHTRDAAATQTAIADMVAQGVFGTQTVEAEKWTPTPTVTPIPLIAVNTATSIPTLIQSSTNTPSSTNTTLSEPTPTVTAESVDPKSTNEMVTPILESPSDGDSKQTGFDTTFEWKWNGELLQDQGFEILVWQGDETHFGAFDTRDVTNQVKSSNNVYQFTGKLKGAYSVTLHGSGEYKWAVAVVKLDPYERIIESSPRKLKIDVGGGGSDGGGGPNPTPAPP